MSGGRTKKCRRPECTTVLSEAECRTPSEFEDRVYCSRECVKLHRRALAAEKHCACGSGAPHYAKGLCWPCYVEAQYGKRIPKESVHTVHKHRD